MTYDYIYFHNYYYSFPLETNTVFDNFIKLAEAGRKEVKRAVLVEFVHTAQTTSQPTNALDEIQRSKQA